MTTVGGFEASARPARSRPIISRSSSHTNLMTRGQALEDFLTNCLFANSLDEVFDNLEIDVGFEQRETNLFQGFCDVLFGKDPGTTQLFKNLLEFFAERIQHSVTNKKAIEAVPPDLRSPRKF